MAHNNFSSSPSSMNPHSTTTQESEPQPPHDALHLVSPYLPVIDLLSLTQVCKSFNDSIPNDVLTWLHIYIDKPLNIKVTDDTLLKIASRANGRIRTLALIDCGRVTDHGLQQVVDSNPLIEKLYLPGCTRLSPEGIVCAVKTLSTSGHGLKALKINNIHHMTKEHLNSLHSYFPTQNELQNQAHHPTYFHNRNKLYLHQDHAYTPSIDVDICPKCSEITQVFDCPRSSCNQNDVKWKCRGCRYCIMRCEECGECLKDDYYGDDDDVVESSCGDSLCPKCWLMLPKCDFCNKAYCKKHGEAEGFDSGGGSSGFVCNVCLGEDSDDDLE